MCIDCVLQRVHDLIDVSRAIKVKEVQRVLSELVQCIFCEVGITAVELHAFELLNHGLPEDVVLYLERAPQGGNALY